MVSNARLLELEQHLRGMIANADANYQLWCEALDIIHELLARRELDHDHANPALRGR